MRHFLKLQSSLVVLWMAFPLVTHAFNPQAFKEGIVYGVAERKAAFLQGIEEGKAAFLHGIAEGKSAFLEGIVDGKAKMQQMGSHHLGIAHPSGNSVPSSRTSHLMPGMESMEHGSTSLEKQRHFHQAMPHHSLHPAPHLNSFHPQTHSEVAFSPDLKQMPNGLSEIHLSQEVPVEFRHHEFNPIQSRLTTEQPKIEGTMMNHKDLLDPINPATGLHESKTGLSYKVLKEGNGPVPGPRDKVEVHYHGTLVDKNGKTIVFDSSVDRGESISFPVNGVIQGWQEALQKMPVGSKWEVNIPSALAYGPRGAGGKIGPNADLKFEIELLAIK